jgi:hypothetical protein
MDPPADAAGLAPAGFTTGPAAPVPARPPGGRGVAGASALAEYRRSLALYRLLTRRRRRGQIAAAGVLGALTGLVAFVYVAGVTHAAERTGRLATVTALLVATGTAAALARRWTRPPQPIEAWRRGAAGERRVARALERLVPLGYTVLYDRALPGTGANADALVIGPGGVFLIDAKNYRAPLRVGRDGQVYAGRVHLGPTCATVRFVAGRAAGALAAQLGAGWSVAVQPVLALAGPPPPRRLAVEGIPAVAARQLARYLTSRPAHLSPFQVGALAAAAAIALPPHPAPSPDPRARTRLNGTASFLLSIRRASALHSLRGAPSAPPRRRRRHFRC